MTKKTLLDGVLRLASCAPAVDLLTFIMISNCEWQMSRTEFGQKKKEFASWKQPFQILSPNSEKRVSPYRRSFHYRLADTITHHLCHGYWLPTQIYPTTLLSRITLRSAVAS